MVNNDIKLIYARFGMGGVQMLPLKARTGLPLLTSFHGSDVSRQLQIRPGYRNRLPVLFDRGDAFTVVCEYMKQQLIQLGCQAEKITVIKSGIDLEKFPFQPKPKIEAERVRILSVGRLTEKKGMIDLIQAFAKIAVLYPKAKLVIVGDGEERNRIRRLVNEYGLTQQVDLKGRLEHHQVQKELERCDLFVLASRTAVDGNEEGIPNVIMEAMATGRPVIATRHSGIPELVENEHTGYLVNEKSPEEIASMIFYALENQTSWQASLENARLKVEQEHDVVKQIEKLERLMDELIL